MLGNNYGEYEIKVEAKKYSIDKPTTMTFIIEADNKTDAQKKAENRLKKNGYKHYKFESVQQIKQITKISSNIESKTGKNFNPQQKKGAIIVAVVGVLFLVLVFVLVCTGVIG